MWAPTPLPATGSVPGIWDQKTLTARSRLHSDQRAIPEGGPALASLRPSGDANDLFVVMHAC